MSTPIETLIKAPNGCEFMRQLAGFAVEAYGRVGIGVVVIRDRRFLSVADAWVEATALYVPYEGDQSPIPPESVESLDQYDPKKEFVLAVLRSDGSVILCMQMPLNNPHLPPRSRNVPYRIGAVLHLKTAIGEIQPGYYLFRGERGACIRLAPVVKYDEFGFLPGDTILDIHSDFCELFDRTGIVIHPRWW